MKIPLLHKMFKKIQIYREDEKRNPPQGAVMLMPGELYKPEKKEEKQ